MVDILVNFFSETSLHMYTYILDIRRCMSSSETRATSERKCEVEGEKLSKFMVDLVILVVHVGVEASAEREAQAGSGGLWGRESGGAAAAIVKLIGNQLGINRDGPADGLNLWCI